MIISYLKMFFTLWKQHNVKKQVLSSTKMGHNPIISSSANVKLLWGSSPEDIRIGNSFKLSGELISSHKGKISIGNYSLVGPNCVVGAVNSVTIGDYVLISNNVIVIDNNNHPVNPYDRLIMNKQSYDSPYRNWKYSVSSPIVICNNVWIGRNSIINKGVTIGENAIVAANSVVTKDVPTNCIVAGNPAKVVKWDIQNEVRLIDYNL